jgi:carboxymethylenebutenolidase
MERKKATDFPQELLNLFDKYIHGGISRRAFLDGAQKFAVGGVTATGLLEMLAPNYAWAIQVQPDDSRIKGEKASVPSPQGNEKIDGYLVKPANASGKLPVVLVVHENRGLNPYIEDVARRLAIANFIAFAPDGLTSKGGYPGDEEKGAQLFQQVDGGKMREDFLASAKWLKARPDSTGKVGAVGFCFGGLMINRLAASSPELDAGVAYYGRQVPAAQVPNIKASLLLHYAENDEPVNAGIPAYEAALKANNKKYTIHVYLGTQHAFNNDTGAARYNKAAADLAWGRTLAFFKETLGAPPNAA